MNEILQKRIEEAAKIYAESEVNRMDTSTYSMHEKKRLKMFDGYDIEEALTSFFEQILQNQWISVDEVLPEKEQYVLVAVLDTIKNEYNYGFDAVTDSTEVVTDEHGFRIWADTDKITHWTPIPELPKGDEQ